MNVKRKWFAITGGAVAVAAVIAVAGTTLPTAFAQTVANTSQTTNQKTPVEKSELQSLWAQVKTQRQAEQQLNQQIHTAIAAWKQANPITGLTADQKSQLQSLKQTKKGYSQQLKQLRPQIQKLEEQMEQARANHDTTTVSNLRSERQPLMAEAKTIRQELQSVNTSINTLIPLAQRQAFHQKAVALKSQTGPIRTNLKTYQSQRKALVQQIKADRPGKNWTPLETELQLLIKANQQIATAKSQLLSLLQQQP